MNLLISKKLPKVFIFDVGGTIFDVININFDNAIIYLYNNVIDNTKVTLDEFKASMQDIHHAFRDRELNSFELSYEYLFNYVTFIYGNPKSVKKEEIENDFSHAFYQGNPIPNVLDFLEYLKNKGVKLYVLSNSILTTPQIRREVEEYGALKYFIDVVSTGDYIFRKPSEDIFKLYIKKLKLEGFKESDLCYIGNSFRFDIVTPTRLGMNTIHFAVDEDEDIYNVVYLKINSYNHLISLFKENFGD